STGGTSASTSSIVEFYSRLPKGPAPASASSGIRGKFFDGKNASGKPLVAFIGGMMVFGYTIDYHTSSPQVGRPRVA
ncbi:ATP synthase f chain, mitochondrial precursor, partial [Tulasnella sp. 417]